MEASKAEENVISDILPKELVSEETMELESPKLCWE